jgi:hypothetical protein
MQASFEAHNFTGGRLVPLKTLNEPGGIVNTVDSNP